MKGRKGEKERGRGGERNAQSSERRAPASAKASAGKAGHRAQGSSFRYLLRYLLSQNYGGQRRLKLTKHDHILRVLKVAKKKYVMNLFHVC